MAISAGPASDARVRAAPLTFLHLSDIHFRHRQGSAQFDLDAQLRKPLLDDIKSKPADLARIMTACLSLATSRSAVKKRNMIGRKHGLRKFTLKQTCCRNGPMLFRVTTM